MPSFARRHTLTRNKRKREVRNTNYMLRADQSLSVGGMNLLSIIQMC